MTSYENEPDLSMLYVETPSVTENMSSEDTYQASTPSYIMDEISVTDNMSSNGNLFTPSYLYDDVAAENEVENYWDLVPCDQGYYQSGSSSGILMDLATNEKHVHADFYNDFEDLFDDDDDLPLNSNN